MYNNKMGRLIIGDMSTCSQCLPNLATNHSLNIKSTELLCSFAGLGALSPPLPAHTTLSPPRPIAGLATMNYTHPSLGTMSQFLDSMTSLATTQQSPYKTVAVGQPAYTLESPGRNQEGRLSMTTPTTMSKVMAFTDAHTSKDLAPSYTSSPTSNQTFSDSAKSWGLSNFVPATSVSGIQYSMPADHVTSTGFTPNLEPPPAHSGSLPSHRASTIQRNPYKEYPQPALQPAHSGGSRGNQTVYSAAVTTEREPPTAHSRTHFTVSVCKIIGSTCLKRHIHLKYSFFFHFRMMSPNE